MKDTGSKRILPIDASRGLVMLFSCLAHFAWWIHAPYPEASATLAAIGMVATPTFLLLSGAMVSMLCATPGGSGRDLRSQLFNRGLFLLTVGHLLIALSEAHLNGGIWKTLPGVTVVDEIGLCTLIAAFFLPELARADLCLRLARVAAVVLAIAWAANVYWLPADAASRAFEDVLISGNVAGVHLTEHSPKVQHLAIYVMGLPLGHFFASYVQQKVSLADIARRLRSLGAQLVAVTFALRLVRYFFDHVSLMHSPAMDLTLKITEKTPPSPAYLLFYGGCGLLLIGTLFQLSASTHRSVRGALEWLAVIGRASLFVFVLQYFLYWTLPDLLNVQPNLLSVFVFIVNVLLIRYAAGAWVHLRGNRWLTFGIKLGSLPAPRS